MELFRQFVHIRVRPDQYGNDISQAELEKLEADVAEALEIAMDDGGIPVLATSDRVCIEFITFNSVMNEVADSESDESESCSASNCRSCNC